jgi:Zn-dependent protease with chaperone function
MADLAQPDLLSAGETGMKPARTNPFLMESDAPHAEFWQIRGPVAPAKLSPLYRLGTFFAAAGMVLLPLIYVGMIAGLGWWIYDFASAGPSVTPGRRKGQATFFTYVVPIVVGVIVIIFMIKPLFSRRPKSVEPRALRREDEPRLFAFIEQVCDLVRAPRPRRVLVDLNVNASASLSHGLWSLFSRNLTLTIGLPLAGGLSARQFGGVLAHEFGHFAQGAGMKTTYVVRMVSFWFARVVYERDRLDAALEDWAKGLDIRLGIVLHAARLMVWCARRILWVLMWVGQLISSVLMRQMEFDADHYEIQTAGSEGFITTARRLRVLGLGAHITHEKQREAYQAKRLVDDLPGWMLHETRELPEETRVQIAKHAENEKTGWFDTHPSDAERIACAEAAKSEGVLQAEVPASALFSNFAGLSQEVTTAFYREVLELKPGTIALEPLARMTGESDEAKRGDVASEKYFDGVLGARAMVFLNPADVAACAENWRERSLAARAPASEEEKAASKELHEGFGREHGLRAVLGFDEASIGWKAEELQLASTKDARPALATLLGGMTRAEQTLAPCLARFRSRLAAAVAANFADASTPPEAQAEVRRCIATLNFIEGIEATLRMIFVHTAPLGAILENMERASKAEAVFPAVKRLSDALAPQVQAVLDRAKDVAYPLPHALGTVSMQDYLTSEVSHSDPMILTFLRGGAILDRIYAVYRRIIGRLAILATAVEAQIDQPSTAAV